MRQRPFDDHDREHIWQITKVRVDANVGSALKHTYGKDSQFDRDARGFAFEYALFLLLRMALPNHEVVPRWVVYGGDRGVGWDLRVGGVCIDAKCSQDRKLWTNKGDDFSARGVTHLAVGTVDWPELRCATFIGFIPVSELVERGEKYTHPEYGEKVIVRPDMLRDWYDLVDLCSEEPTE